MDPVSLAVVVATYGTDKVLSAFLGETISSLTRQIMGVADSLERAESRLAEMDRKLDALVEQRYTVSMGVGLRTFRQGLSRAAGSPERSSEILEAGKNFLVGTQAAQTKLQQARAERLLTLTYLATADLTAAAQAQTALDSCIGDACYDLYYRHLRAEDEARKLVEPRRGGLRRNISNDGQFGVALARIRSDVAEAFVELRQLLEDSIALGRLLGRDDGIPAQRDLVQLPRGEPTSLIVRARVRRPVQVAGTSVVFDGPFVRFGYPGRCELHFTAKVRVDGTREAVQFEIREGAAALPDYGEPTTLLTLKRSAFPKPGESAEAIVVVAPPDFPQVLSVTLGGILVATRINPLDGPYVNAFPEESLQVPLEAATLARNAIRELQQLLGAGYGSNSYPLSELSKNLVWGTVEEAPQTQDDLSSYLVRLRDQINSFMSEDRFEKPWPQELSGEGEEDPEDSFQAWVSVPVNHVIRWRMAISALRHFLKHGDPQVPDSLMPIIGTGVGEGTDAWVRQDRESIDTVLSIALAMTTELVPDPT